MVYETNSVVLTTTCTCSINLSTAIFSSPPSCARKFTVPANTEVEMECTNFNVRYGDTFTLNLGSQGLATFTNQDVQNNVIEGFPVKNYDYDFRVECQPKYDRSYSDYTCKIKGLSSGPTAPPPSTNYCQCGIANNPSNRIVGGHEAILHQFPWQVGLVLDGSNTPFCGGTIIANKWILTAGHCANNPSYDMSRVKVLVGEDRIKTDSYDHTVRASIRRVYEHPQYHRDRHYLVYDFALLELNQPLTWSSEVRPVCLPEKHETSSYAGMWGKVSGWGTLQSGSDGM